MKTKIATLTATVNQERKKEEKKQKKRESKECLETVKTDSQNSQFQCNLCDMKSESRLSLQNHVRLFHIKSSFTQTNEILLEDKNIGTCETESNSELFVKYPCYYCDREIANEENLRRHGLSCTQLVFLSNQVSSLTVSTIHPRNEP